MSRASRERRDARRRSQQRTTRVSGGAGAHTQAEIIGLIEVATRYASISPRAATDRIAELNQIGAAATSAELDPAELVVDEVLSRIAAAWEHGWQPLDLVHATRRRASSAAARWITRVVLVEADRAGAPGRAPQRWAEQLAALAGRGRRTAGPDTLLAPRGRATLEEWLPALAVLELMRRLPRSQVLMPPPSQWGRTARVTAAPPRPGSVHAKTLTRVRALLAKAESTEFAAEAEAFTAKAQDIMARHAIDEALLADGSGASVDVHGIRVLIHHPYALQKAGLLDVIARANRARAVWHDFASSMTLVGVPTDLDQVEMLFTSTLVQATRAMTRAGEHAGPSSGDRSSAFRKAFLSAYASRIGDRLTASTEDAAATYGSDLVPVFQRQAAAIDEEFERLFPRVTTGSRRTQLDARGWNAGIRAADAAVLPSGMVES